MKRLVTIVFVACSLCCSWGQAQEATQNSGTKRALILCGLTGDDEFKEQFTESVQQISDALTGRFGFKSDDIRLQFGRADNEEPFAEFPSAGRATREEIADEAARLVKNTKPNDTAWVFVVGHAYFDGKTSFYNIPEADLSHKQFAKLFDKLGGHSVFFVCTPVSGYYIKGLSKPNRIIITSTEPDIETNGPRFDTALAKTLTDINDSNEFDLDKNGVVSLLDLYIKTTQNLSDLYLENDPPLIPTEHPQIDDNGDGKGSEMQIDYLTLAQGGRSDAKRKRKFRKFKDGAFAAQQMLKLVSK